MAKDRPAWLADLSAGFKRHRRGRPGWFIEVNRDNLRVVSAELPLRPDDPPGTTATRRAVTLRTPPGPATFKDALSECCDLYDAVMAGTWQWPDPSAPSSTDPGRLSPATLDRLVDRLRLDLVGERIGLSTWHRTYAPYLSRLVGVAGDRNWPEDFGLLRSYLRNWPPDSRARQMAHDRARRLWKLAGWEWPQGLIDLRGNGKAAADPEGVRAFSDAEIAELRARVLRSYKLKPADLVAWDCLICFGLRPAELQGLQLTQQSGQLQAKVTRQKSSSKGSSGARIVPAVPPGGWPTDCHGLLQRWQEHGLPDGMVAARSPGEVLGQQLNRLGKTCEIESTISPELTPYGLRHAFALRLAMLGLHVREAAQLMGHSPAVHLSTYGRRLDQPKLMARVQQLVQTVERG